MRTTVFFIFLCSIAFGQVQPVLWQVESDTIKQWNYFFGDEFNGSEINQDLWHQNYPWGGLSLDVGIYAAKEMVEPSNGFVKLKIDTTSEWRKFPKWMLDEKAIEKYNVEVRNGNEVQLKHLISALWSKKQFKYGYFECRALAPSGKGLWPGFWLYGGHPNDEIDFMEMKGEKTKHLHVDIHCPNDCDKVKNWIGIKKNWGGWIKASEEITDKYVVYSGLWTPGNLMIYMNGQAIAEYNGDFGTNMNLIANISVAQDKGPFSPGPDKNTVFPNEFIIDYMRVWKSENDQILRTEEKEIVRPEYIENPIIDKNAKEFSNAKLKRPVGLIFNKKKFKKHLGYVSLLQQSKGQLLIEKNGNFKSPVSVILCNSNNEKLKEIELFETQNTFDVSEFKKGKYFIKLLNEGLTSTVAIEL